jgi:glycosyltransferase involved in cell wall biosynthesis
LIHCIEQVKIQNFNRPYEHIIVSDGLDNEIKFICGYYKIRSICIEKEKNTGESKGHLARDTGINLAKGKYVVLWDDDNIYYKDALSYLYETVQEYEIGICNIYFLTKNSDPNFPIRRAKDSNEIYWTIPKKWLGFFVYRDIDTMNVIVKKDIAKSVLWTNSKKYEGDFDWLNSIDKLGITKNYSEKYIGIKI